MSQVLFDTHEVRSVVEVVPSVTDTAAPETAAPEATPETPASCGNPRLRVPQRDQVEFQWAALDQLVEPNHPVRAVWAAVCGLDLSHWLGQIKAVEGNVGRDATDPRLLVALWVYATLDAVGSARELARLCKEHIAYRWLCGGVSVNYHMLSDFRSQHPQAWDELLTQIVAGLLEEDLVTMKRVAQDGMRTRAHAGQSSFRRKGTLEKHLQEAREQVEALKQQGDEPSGETTPRQHAARERAARERMARIESAIQHVQQLQQQREASAKQSGREVKEARCSTTDPEARTMQHAHGGFQPGYNVQFATDTASGVIVGVEVTNAGTDSEQLAPMLEQLKDRYQKTPEEMLVDGGFATLGSIDAAAEQGCNVFAPVKDAKKQEAAGKDPYAPKPRDSAAVAAWRQRMGEAASQALYKLRCQTAEWVNAVCRNHGLYQMPVRGQLKCRSVALLHAITHNLLTGTRLRLKTSESTQ